MNRPDQAHDPPKVPPGPGSAGRGRPFLRASLGLDRWRPGTERDKVPGSDAQPWSAGEGQTHRDSPSAASTEGDTAAPAGEQEAPTLWSPPSWEASTQLEGRITPGDGAGPAVGAVAAGDQPSPCSALVCEQRTVTRIRKSAPKRHRCLIYGPQGLATSPWRPSWQSQDLPWATPA